MRKRKRTRPMIDKRVFRNTADQTHVLNVKPPIVRGGFRF